MSFRRPFSIFTMLLLMMLFFGSWNGLAYSLEDKSSRKSACLMGLFLIEALSALLITYVVI